MSDTPTAPTTTPVIAPAPTIVEEPDTRPVTDDGDHDRFAHIVRKDDQMKGYVMGEEVRALCGKVWVPSRDPDRYPVCPACKERLGQIRAAGGN
jgi:hypothetical protein